MYVVCVTCVLFAHTVSVSFAVWGAVFVLEKKHSQDGLGLEISTTPLNQCRI